jgi:hypothetical protein
LFFVSTYSFISFAHPLPREHAWSGFLELLNAVEFASPERFEEVSWTWLSSRELPFFSLPFPSLSQNHFNYRLI